MASIKRLFRKPKFLKKKPKAAPTPEVSQNTEPQDGEGAIPEVPTAEAQSAAPRKRKLLSRFKIFRKPKFLKKKAAAAQTPVLAQETAPVQKKQKLKRFKKTRLFFTRRRNQVVNTTKQLPKQIGEKAKQRFESSWAFKKYRVPVENSKWFKKAKPIVMKPFLERQKRKFRVAERLDTIRKAPSERAYQEAMYTRLIKEASELSPFRRLHDLNAINRRLTDYIANVDKTVLAPLETNRLAKVVPFRKPAAETVDAGEVAAHKKKMQAMNAALEKKIDDVVVKHTREIAENPNYAWVLTPRVSQKFALPAAKYIQELIAEKKATPPDAPAGPKP